MATLGVCKYVAPLTLRIPKSNEQDILLTSEHSTIAKSESSYSLANNRKLETLLYQGVHCDISLTHLNSDLSKPGQEAFDFQDTFSDSKLTVFSSNLDKPEREEFEDFPDTSSDTGQVVFDSNLSKPGREPSMNEVFLDTSSDPTLDSNFHKPLRAFSMTEGFPDAGNHMEMEEKPEENDDGFGPLHLLRRRVLRSRAEMTVMENRSAHGTGVRMRSRNHEVVPEKEMARGLQPVSEKSHVQVRHRGLNNIFLVMVDGAVRVQHVQHLRVMQSVFSKQKLFHEPSGRVLTYLQHVVSRSFVAVSPSTQKVISMQETTTTNTGCSSHEVTVSLHGSPPRSPVFSSTFCQPDLPMACLFLEFKAGPHVCLQPVLFPEGSLDCTDGRLMVVPGKRMAFQFQSAEEAFKAFRTMSKLLKCCRAVLVTVRLEKSMSPSSS